MIGLTYGNLASSGVGSFLPSDINGLVLWLDSSSDYINGGSPTDLDAVSTWVNRGTGSTDATQGTALNQPIWHENGFGTNSNPYLSFDGVNSFMGLGTEYSKIAEHTIFTVHIRNSATTNSQVIIGDGDPSTVQTSSCVHRYRNNQLDVAYGDDVNLRLLRTTQTYTSTSDVYITSDIKTAGVAISDIQSNNAPTTENNIAGSATTIAGTPNTTSIGRWGTTLNSGANQYLDAKVAEILFYDSPLSAEDYASVMTYLNNKYAAY